jgi:SulP family sulfate permease
MLAFILHRAPYAWANRPGPDYEAASSNASIAAPLVGSTIVSGQLMQISTTSASALAAGQAIATCPDTQRDGALFLLVVLIGVFLAVFALLRLGRLVRFVSHAVMTGFLAGVAVVLILDQSAPLVGAAPEGSNEVIQFVNLLRHVAASPRRR